MGDENMSFDKMREIIGQMQNDPKVYDLLAEYDESGDESRVYGEIAEKLGYGVTPDDFKEYYDEAEKIIRSKTDAIILTIPDEELNMVAGGKNEGHSDCKNTYYDKENCWFNDGCDNVYHMYDKYLCKWYYYLKDEV
ncbi:MAG: hypothetical protein IK152_03135 [Lachnospiraceae bacterium]|nr:hypothetical protein [Lachnospiraceae bacterium]